MNISPLEPRDLHSFARGARSVGLSPRQVRSLAARGKLAVTQLPGGRPMISVAQLRELIKSSTRWGSGVPG
jgi:hypothetical protein